MDDPRVMCKALSDMVEWTSLSREKSWKGYLMYGINVRMCGSEMYAEKARGIYFKLNIRLTPRELHFSSTILLPSAKTLWVGDST